jgi:hypothetical protein
VYPCRVSVGDHNTCRTKRGADPLCEANANGDARAARTKAGDSGLGERTPMRFRYEAVEGAHRSQGVEGVANQSPGRPRDATDLGAQGREVVRGIKQVNCARVDRDLV